jgi:anti-sigma B factor antagonist
MPEPTILHIEDLPGSLGGIHVLRLAGSLTLANVYSFRCKVKADDSRMLILDLSTVTWADSAGIGALVEIYVSRQKSGRGLGLVGVNSRIHRSMAETHVDALFHFYETVAEAEQAA